MQNTLLNIAESLEGADMVDSRLSFTAFIDFLKNRKLHEKTLRMKFLDFVIGHFEQRLAGKEPLTLETIGAHEDLLQLIYATLFPAIEDEQESLWALSMPMKPVIFYGTEPFYSSLQDMKTKKIKPTMLDNEHKERRKMNFEFMYSFVLKKLYNYTYDPPASMLVNSWDDMVTGLPRFFRLNIDTRFVQIVLKGPLPELDLALLQSLTHEPGAALDFLKEQLPLSLFRFEGISAITVTDITADYVVEKIKNIILNQAVCDKDSDYDNVLRSLKTLAGKVSVDFGLLPFLKVNDRPVFLDNVCYHSMLASAARQCGQMEGTYMSMAGSYFQDPKLVFFEQITEEMEGKHHFLSVLRQSGVKTYALLPIFHNHRLAGALEVYSREEGVLDLPLLSRLDIVVPLLAQLLQRSIYEFDDAIKTVIKENFTSIQPAVEWKFHDAAWQFLKDHHGEASPPAIGTIYFEDVYPLYGAIDIRNSTIERNKALGADLRVQFDTLVRVLSGLRKEISLELLDELIFRCEQWQEALSDELTTADEMDLNAFLENEVAFLFSHVKQTRPDLDPIIAPYREAIDESTGAAFAHRRELEVSIQLINKTINGHLEAAIEELQKSYPSYFEKFRTDGVEYDIYIGQSIAPEKPFDGIYLKNLRLWQLSSMATIARLTHSLLPQMPGKLQTTQLLFVHSNPIDISFRKDERRFDVEGGYNIRYQIVKKRIDKVHIKGGTERLTQPGKIAVIYFNDREAEEYLGYVNYLQEKGVLTGELEHLELEELQGVSGLRAFRVGVRLE